MKEKQTADNKTEIAILDFGSQYTHLIARRVRELGVVSHIYPTDVPVEKLTNAAGLILSGGPRSVVSQPLVPYDPKILTLNVPILGLCYGHQLFGKIFGGEVERGRASEYGLARLTVRPSPIFKNLPQTTAVWMSHGDHVSKLPPGFKQIGWSGTESIAAMANETRKIYGFQFHPEVRHSRHGKQMLKNFVFNICRAPKNWSTNAMLKNIENEIAQQANCHPDRSDSGVEGSLGSAHSALSSWPKGRNDKKNIFLLVSGGVDSTVCFALLEKALGKQRVYGLHIDSGLMRLNETAKISAGLKRLGFDNLHVYNAEREFLPALKGVTDPEKKRSIIGNLYLDIAAKIRRQKKMFGPNWLLGQGTIYPDTIESGGTRHADVIKTHHNRVPRVLRMMRKGKIIEPLKDLYKDEVRALGLKLGLPPELIWRHPFPGPGLAIRCLCSKGSAELACSLPPLTKGGHRGVAGGWTAKSSGKLKIYKLPLKSVGVQGDERSYAHPAVIVPRPLPTLPLKGEGMRRSPPFKGEIKRGSRVWQSLHQLSPLITNTHRDINRVLLLLHGAESDLLKSRLQKSYLTKSRLELLRTIDDIVDTAVLNDPRCKHIWQLPTVLVPFGYNHGESVVLRPVESEEAMTVSWARIPDATLKNIIKKITSSLSRDVDFIFFDLTNKPPGTIEWE